MTPKRNNYFPPPFPGGYLAFPVRRPRSGRHFPPPRGTIRALAMLAEAASVRTTRSPTPARNENQYQVVRNDVVRVSEVVNPDLNLPPEEEDENPPEPVQSLPPNEGHHHRQLLHPLPVLPNGGVPEVYYALPRVNGRGFPFNFVEGDPLYTIRVRSTNLHDVGIRYSLRATESMYHIFQDYSQRVDLESGEIVIKRYNNVVSRFETAFSAGLQDGDTLSVEPQENGNNVDTRFKEFMIQDLGSIPKELKVRAVPNDTLYGVCQLWANRNNIHPRKIITFYDNGVVTSLDTVAEAGIKNQGRLYLLSNDWRNPWLILINAEKWCRHLVLLK
ncbi:uncharacterized protein LOC110733257 [Chenopodium quinoa]|uniref:uncharacterized protein LOC110733257 n=1 Tax=Chenopodium quinoa TaxID=63459 RepID=UPI000B7827A6|nr:uncharacterized protein LOC110733257 [Chenopodium quinoa]